MSQDVNLMGLGLPAALAMRIANAGTGPVMIAATGQTLGGKQFLVYVGSGTGGVTLPKVGGSDNAPEIGDDFVIHNGLSGSLTVAVQSGTTVNIGGSANATNFTLATKTTFTGWVVSSTQWFGIVA